ncbi:MAG: YbaN family protein [Pseudomonadota bacterium]
MDPRNLQQLLRNSNPTRIFWFMIGVVSISLGLIGVVVPLLPTTPFVILAAFAFGRSIPAVEIWLVNSRTFGPMIADWRKSGAIATRYKIIALIMMAAAFGLSIFMQLSLWILTVQAICILLAGTFIVTRPSSTTE